MGQISNKINKIKNEIPDNVDILAAAKTRTAKEIRETVESGVEVIGENYIQELEDRYGKLKDINEKIEWHVIGHLQSNKINRALRLCDNIQTIESKKKARAINKRVPKADRESLPVLIEINIGEEESKFGVEPDWKKIQKLARSIDGMDYLKLKGLMTIEPYGESEEVIRPYFKKMKQFFDQLKEMELRDSNIKTLSMGISNSYKIAIEEGSTMVRLGRAIYGPRDYS